MCSILKTVVNCFQFVIWRSLTHQIITYSEWRTRCELLSICDLTIFDTPRVARHIQCYMLWIAFNLWFDDLWHTDEIFYLSRRQVVNCFQFVIWRSLTHRPAWAAVTFTCCELLSICDLTIFDTPSRAFCLSNSLLWIAFNLWFDDLWHTNVKGFTSVMIVVNCFQFVIWRSLTHHNDISHVYRLCCELLSICDLTIFDTPVMNFFCANHSLWIAFNLWFDDLWHTFAGVHSLHFSVVNCFQFVIWRSLTHQRT